MEKVVFKIYQAVDNLLASKPKKFKAIIILFFVILIPLLIYCNYKYKFSVPQDTLYWVFSSIVQALLAFVAVFGVMVVFKLQSIRLSEERLIEELNKPGSPLATIGGDLSATTAEELLNNIKKRIGNEKQNQPEDSSYSKLKRAKDRLETYSLTKIFLQMFMSEFIIYVSIVVVLSLILLAFSHIISQYNFGLPAIFLVIILTIHSLLLAIKGTKRVFLSI